ncbi:MAG: hypothetical protein JW727_02620 [Candidatus Aenigmarchaeota archaeon]|nr:hypothetical protein [Candidatus Aenigmarchaeota archaeon]
MSNSSESGDCGEDDGGEPPPDGVSAYSGDPRNYRLAIYDGYGAFGAGNGGYGVIEAQAALNSDYLMTLDDLGPDGCSIFWSAMPPVYIKMDLPKE